RGTRRNGRDVGPVQPQLDRYLPGRHVDNAAGDEKRRHLFRVLAALVEPHVGIVNRADAADAGTDGDTHAVVEFAIQFQATVVERLHGRGHAVVHEGVIAAGFLAGHVLGDVEIADRSTEAGGKTRNVEAVDGADDATPGQNGLPGRIDVQ